MAADTSSAPAASTAVVWVAAAALAALSADSIPAKSEAAAVRASGPTITNDIWHLPGRRGYDVIPNWGCPDAPARNRYSDDIAIRPTTFRIPSNLRDRSRARQGRARYSANRVCRITCDPRLANPTRHRPGHRR